MNISCTYVRFRFEKGSRAFVVELHHVGIDIDKFLGCFYHYANAPM